MVEPVPGVPPRYRLGELLGRGGQAQTYLAHDTERDTPVAVKVFRLADDQSWKGFELFERECRVLRSLSHEAIPDYVEHGGDEAAGTYYLVMQFIDGDSLEAALQDERRYTDAELRSIFEQLLDVLDYLHSLNPPVIHRDIKPGNVVLAEGMRARLVDFGAVRDVFSDRGKSTVVGTFGYMAPEQLRGESTAASDLYGLAATVAAIATATDAGELPSVGLEIDLRDRVKPGRIRDALQTMLKADPRERTQSVAEVRKRLEAPARKAAVVAAKAATPARADPLAQVEALVAGGYRIQAIKHYRTVTNASLRDATAAVNALELRYPAAKRELVPVDPADNRKASYGGLIAVLTCLVMFKTVGLFVAPVAFLFTRSLLRGVFRGLRSSS